ncbi:MAG: C80 family cysteine peptidase, partial [Bacteroidota bacterium]
QAAIIGAIDGVATVASLGAAKLVTSAIMVGAKTAAKTVAVRAATMAVELAIDMAAEALIFMVQAAFSGEFDANEFGEAMAMGAVMSLGMNGGMEVAGAAGKAVKKAGSAAKKSMKKGGKGGKVGTGKSKENGNEGKAGENGAAEHLKDGKKSKVGPEGHSEASDAPNGEDLVHLLTTAGFQKKLAQSPNPEKATAQLALETATRMMKTLDHVDKAVKIGHLDKVKGKQNVVLDILGHGNTRELGNQDALKMARNILATQGYEKIKKIRLIACKTGEDPNGFAARLKTYLDSAGMKVDIEASASDIRLQNPAKQLDGKADNALKNAEEELQKTLKKVEGVQDPELKKTLRQQGEKLR